MPVNGDAAVVSDTLWQRAHPMLLNNACPFSSDVVCVVGVGGAESRMNALKLMTSEGELPTRRRCWCGLPVSN